MAWKIGSVRNGAVKFPPNAQIIVEADPVTGASSTAPATYQLVAVSQTNKVLGATGAIGDYIEGLLITVATAATAQVQLKDGAGTAFTIFPNSPGSGIGAYYYPVKLTSLAGAWAVTTGAGVTVLATGRFT